MLPVIAVALLSGLVHGRYSDTPDVIRLSDFVSEDVPGQDPWATRSELRSVQESVVPFSALRFDAPGEQAEVKIFFEVGLTQHETRLEPSVSR